MQTYQEALDYLYSFTDFERQRPQRGMAQAFDLGRMRVLMQALGNPQQRYPSLHIAGTKGKGSTSALCAAALQQAGYKTGFYSSPHLQDFRERIRVGGAPIAREALLETVAEVRRAAESVPGLTTFELTTAAGFVYFARCQVDFAVVEVGVGGRLDATNVIVPLEAVITSLSYDHTHWLGNTLAEIAGEKAGIIKPGVPVVSAPQQPEALAVLERVAAERGAPLEVVGRDWEFALEGHSLAGQSFSVWPAGNRDGAVRLKTPLLGAFQAENGAVAYAALLGLRRRGLSIPAEAVLAGFAGVDWPGRFEVLGQGSPALVADSAHNGESAGRLAEALHDYFPGRPVTLLFGASSDKAVQAMFAALLPGANRVIMTQAVHPRAIDPDELVEQARPYGVPAEAVSPVRAALARALQAAGPRGVVAATGSVFVVAEVRAAWADVQSSIALPVAAGE